MATNYTNAMGNGEHNIFAPTEDAFEALGTTELEALFASPGNLTMIIGHHAMTGGEHTTLHGKPLTITVD